MDWSEIADKGLPVLGTLLGVGVGGFLTHLGQRAEFRERRSELLRERRAKLYVEFLAHHDQLRSLLSKTLLDAAVDTPEFRERLKAGLRQASELFDTDGTRIEAELYLYASPEALAKALHVQDSIPFDLLVREDAMEALRESRDAEARSRYHAAVAGFTEVARREIYGHSG